MIEHPFGVAVRVIRDRLMATEEIWADRVRLDMPKSNDTRPVVVIWKLSDHIWDYTKRKLAQFVIGVKVIDDDFLRAMTAAQRIAELLDGATLNGGNDWDVVMCSQGNGIHAPEQFIDTQTIYHEGFQFRIWLERKG